IPFFAIHFPLTLAWHAWNAAHERGGQVSLSSRRMFRSAAIAVLAMALFAIPWIGVISAKYHRLVFSTVGPPNHAALGPPEGIHQASNAFVIPKSPYFSQGETPDAPPVQDWSPFHSLRFFKFQVMIAVHHAGRLVLDVFATDFSGLTLAAALAAIVMGIV